MATSHSHVNGEGQERMGHDQGSSFWGHSEIVATEGKAKAEARRSSARGAQVACLSLPLALWRIIGLRIGSYCLPRDHGGRLVHSLSLKG